MKAWRFVILFSLIPGGRACSKRLGISGRSARRAQGVEGFPKQVGNWQQTGGDDNLIMRRWRY